MSIRLCTCCCDPVSPVLCTGPTTTVPAAPYLPPPFPAYHLPTEARDAEDLGGLLYWCAQVRDRDAEVFTVIENIEKAHGTGVIDQQCWKDHASGTRAQDSGRILRWLEENAESYTWTTFNQYFDNVVLLKLLDFHLRHEHHAKGLDFKFDVDGTIVDKKFGPHELVHSDWRILLLVAHQSLLTWGALSHVACPFTYRVSVSSRLRDRLFRPVDGTNSARFVPHTYPTLSQRQITTSSSRRRLSRKTP